MSHRLFTCVIWRLKGEANEYPLKHISQLQINSKHKNFKFVEIECWI
jgi:hypothetical protein